ncbi:MAG: 4-hydroxythreonine-4-phosphate dehydrogenase PdxA [Bacteroidetes bacterium]|nr:4-hydroxythreonine-4-phosphate dehydrogenase PdxA [Bacteroidota bacterium]
MNRPNNIIVGITTGDLAGVGIEIIMKTFMDDRIFKQCTPVLFGNPKVIGFYRNVLEMDNLKYSTIRNFDHLSNNSLNISLAWEDEIAIEPGKPTPETGKGAFLSLQAGVKALKEGKIHILVTAPINKNVIQQDEFRFPGHTEYLQESFECYDSLMFMVSDKLKVGLVTGHLPLSEASSKLSKDKILSKINIMHESLKNDFGIDRPKIAVLALNPHGGDNGLLGNEESEHINPAVAEAKKQGMLVNGAYAADGFFGACKHLAFDGILAMYHDQGLVPFKYMAGDEGVNFTAGLPIVRTSPDHGTAEDIAGKGKASAISFRNSIYEALDIYKTRNSIKEMSANPLKPMKKERRR